jgi:hypothetical protein
MLIGMQNLGERSFMDQQLRQGLAEQSCEVTDLFAANAKCHIYCFFCVDDCDNRKLESRVEGRRKAVSQLLCSTPFDLYDLRGLDVAIGDDMLVCLDALRWAKEDLFNLVPNGETRVKGVIKSWDIKSSIT